MVEALEHSAEHERTTPEKLLERLRQNGRDAMVRDDIRARKAIELVAESAKPIPKRAELEEKPRRGRKSWRPRERERPEIRRALDARRLRLRPCREGSGRPSRDLGCWPLSPKPSLAKWSVPATGRRSRTGTPDPSGRQFPTDAWRRRLGPSVPSGRCESKRNNQQLCVQGSGHPPRECSEGDVQSDSRSSIGGRHPSGARPVRAATNPRGGSTGPLDRLL